MSVRDDISLRTPTIVSVGASSTSLVVEMLPKVYATRQGQPPQPVVHSYRWAVLLIYTSLSCTNQWICFSFSTISVLTQLKFSISDTSADLLATAYFLVYLPFCLLAPWIAEVFSVRTAVHSAALLNFLGGAIRYAGCVTNSYAITLTGQCFCALAQPFYYPLAAQLSSEWFPTAERAVSTGIAVIAVYLGTGLGLLVGPLWVTTLATFDSYLLFQVFLCTLVLAACLTAFPNRPAEGPSPSAPQFRAEERLPVGLDSVKLIGRQIRTLVGTRSFIFLFLAFGINVGCFNVICTVADSIFRQTPSNTWDIAWCFFVFVMGGVLGSFAYGAVLARTQAYKPLIAVSIFCSSLFLILFGTSVEDDSNYTWGVIFVLAGFTGFFLVGLITAGIEYGAELVYPIPECMSSALLLFAEQVFAISLIGTVDLWSMTGPWVLYMLAGMQCVGGVLALFVTDRLGRIEVDMAAPEKSTEKDTVLGSPMPDLSGGLQDLPSELDTPMDAA